LSGECPRDRTLLGAELAEKVKVRDEKAQIDQVTDRIGEHVFEGAIVQEGIQEDNNVGQVGDHA